MLSPTTGKYVSLSDAPQYRSFLTLEIKEGEDLTTFPELFAHFIRNFCTSLESTNEDNQRNLVLDSAAYLTILQKHKTKMLETWADSLNDGLPLQTVSDK